MVDHVVLLVEWDLLGLIQQGAYVLINLQQEQIKERKGVGRETI